MFRPSLISKLSVRGRRSGRWHTTPVAVLEHNGERYLVSHPGVSDWALNLEASRTARLAQPRRVEDIQMRCTCRGARRTTHAYMDRFGKMPTVGSVLRALPDPTDHPMFRITTSRPAEPSVHSAG
jgi:F420H(2)-dependent quinone reductase